MPNSATDQPRDLQKYAWLSIATAIVTISLKMGAYLLTGSVGLLSDAAESVVNLVAAIVALIALRVAAKPADWNHQFGHTKAEYFSAWIEGLMIFIAAAFIIYSAVGRIIDPQPIENVGIGLVISVIAAAINGAVAVVLLRAGRKHRSLTLVADGKHLMTDVWTSGGVVVGVLLVGITGWDLLDPIVAMLVGMNILFQGYKLVQESTLGLMDVAWSDEDNAALADAVRPFRTDEVTIHGVRTRQSGHHRFAEMHVLVPGDWTVWRGHDLLEEIEAAVHEQLEDVQLISHLEPIEDPRAYDDYPAEIPLGETVVDRRRREE